MFPTLSHVQVLWCGFGFLLVAALGTLSATLSASSSAPPGGSRGLYADGAPPGHTGGFGEPTCRGCHFDHRINASGGRLTVRGLPKRYRPDSVYHVEIVLARPGLARAGFQMAVRFVRGEEAGRSAGRFHLRGDRTRRMTAGADGVTYLGHTPGGSRPVAPDTARWSVRWQAPGEDGGRVRLHVAANAANGDDSEFGDFVYARALESAPTGSGSHSRSRGWEKR